MVAARAVLFTEVTFDDGFWVARQEAVQNTTIPFCISNMKRRVFSTLSRCMHAPPRPLPIAYEVTPIGTKPATPGHVLGFRHRQMDRGRRILVSGAARSTAGGTNRGHRRSHRRRTGAGWLFQVGGAKP
jgi:hypothetical protein